MKKTASFVWLIVSSLIIIFPTTTSTQAQSNTTEYVIITEAANIRAAPHLDGGVLQIVYEGDIIDVYNEPHVNGWYRVKLENGFGYIHGNTIALAGYSPKEALFRWNSGGNFVSAPFELPEGHFFVNMSVERFDLVTVRMTSVDGECSDTSIFVLAAVSPKIPSSGYIGSRGCNYVLEVESDEMWSISVEEITLELVEATGVLIEDGTVLEGIGDTSTPVTGLTQGFWKITMIGEGDSIGLTANVLEGDCRYLWEFELADTPVYTTYRTNDNCVIVWEVEGGITGSYPDTQAAEWLISFEKVN